MLQLVRDHQEQDFTAILEQWQDLQDAQEESSEELQCSREIVDKNTIIEVGRRIHSILYGGRDGTVYAIHGEQAPGNVRSMLGGFMVTGGRASFDIVFDNGTISRMLPESILRGVQWRIYADVVDAATIQKQLAHAEKVTEEKKQEERRKATARDQRRAALLQEYGSFLTPVADGGYSSAKLGAANIRKELKQAFPGIKFSVKSSTYSGGDSIDISWDLGPSAADVEKITGKYQEGHFNGMEDIYETDREHVWPELFGGAKYVQTSRHTPEPIYEQLMKDYCQLQKIEYQGHNTQDQGDYISRVINRVLSISSFPANATITGLERTECNCGMVEEFYRIAFK